MSSNGNVFHVTGLLRREFTGHQWIPLRWIPLTKASNAKLWYFLWSAPWINGWVNNHVAGDLRRHYDVILMFSQLGTHCIRGSQDHNIPATQISQCTSSLSHNAPFYNRNVHMFQNGAVWEFCLVHCGIHEMGLLKSCENFLCFSYDFDGAISSQIGTCQSWQLSCRDLCKIVTWSKYYFSVRARLGLWTHKPFVK